MAAERENVDMTFVPSRSHSFQVQFERALRTVDLAGGDATADGEAMPAEARSISDDISVGTSVRTSGTMQIPVLHSANVALFRAREELRQAVDVMALLSGVPSMVPPAAKLFQVIFNL